MRSAGLATLVLLIAAPASAQSTKQIYALVVDRAHSPVTDLAAADFIVKEDGVSREVIRATLASEPMRVILDVDSSQVIGTSLNSVRAALQAFLDVLPPEHEVAFVSTGGQSRVRVPPTLDRGKLKREAAGFFADGGGAALIDSLMETYDRFLKKPSGHWPVWVILTSDGPTGATVRDDAWERFLQDMEVTDTTAHAIVWSTRGNGIGTLASIHITNRTGGHYEAIAAATALPDRMKALATLMIAQHEQAANQYRVEYVSRAKNVQGVEVRVNRPNVDVSLAQRRIVK